jgi:hypothetical protein
MLRMRMTLAFLAIAGLAGLPACSSDSSGPETTPTAAHGTISGVVAAEGSTLEGVTVSLGNKSVTTNQDGWFALTDLATAQDAVVGFELDGYLPTFRTVNVLANQTTHLPSVDMLAADLVVLDAATGGDATTLGGLAGVSFPANAFVTSTGAAYSGDVNVELAAAMPTGADFYDVFPGAFEGEAEGGGIVPFISFGFMGVDLTDDTRGAPLQLADGVTATLSLEIPAGFALAAPDTIPMWYFDEARGVWVEEGEAVKDGAAYVTQVEHLSIWNWDLPITEICQVGGQVQDMDGHPVPDARVISQGLGCTFADEAYTDAGGNFTVRTIKECTAAFTALKGAYASAPAQMDIGTDDTADLPDPLVLSVPAFSITLVWGENPEDLDSHLLIPMTWDAGYDYFHISYYNMGTLVEDPYTALDTDDTESFGPEIIGGTKLYPGKYSYFVHHYSGDGTIGNSPARVTLELGNYYRTWQASNASGSFHPGGFYYNENTQTEYQDYWHVFDFTVGPQGTVNVTSINQAVVSSYDQDGPWNGWDANIFEEFKKSAEGRAKK